MPESRSHHDLDDYTNKATSKIYDKAVKTIRREIARGKTFNEAIVALTTINAALRSIIIDDFLKNLIVDQHFNKGRGLDDLALILDLPYERMEMCRDKIIEELALYHTSYDEDDEYMSEQSDMTH
ncbi:MAG: hypothetical protein C0613_00255 [Desulfobulbaceae bacterium]|nr:MAG: hypothetical protein C0613_00255 [Desulfobulbaceae bacterium]